MPSNTVIALTGYQPVRARELGFDLDGEFPQSPPLTTVRSARGTRHIHIHLAASYHHVQVWDGSHMLLSETVGSRVPHGSGLPAELAGHGYQFASEYRQVSEQDFVESLEVLQARVENSPTAHQLCFPDRGGFAIAVEWFWTNSSVGWESWHCFPEENRVVLTRSLQEF